MKRHKDPVNTPIENGDTQMFVLPPDLLEKLGIKLSNITCPPEGNTENYNVGQYTKNNLENTHSSTDEPSLLETANLMKQSVFMSPTFAPNTAIETINELNVPNIATENEILIQDDNEKPEVVSNNVLNIDDSHKTEDLEAYKSIKECEVKNDGLILTNNVVYESRDIDNVDLSSFSKTLASVEDHADEAYSSDGSNCNSGAVSVITCNKIKVLSEQIINHSDLNTIQNSRIKKSSCYVIPVNTIVTGKPIDKDHSNNHLEQKSVRLELHNNSEINTEINSQIKKVDIKDHNSDTNKDTMLEDLTGDTICPRSIDPDAINESSHKDKTDDKSNIEMEMDKKNSNNNDSNNHYIREEGKDKEKIMNDCTKEAVSNTETSCGKSKLCIQGVEKPGGMYHEKNASVIVKTYQRSNVQKRIPVLPRVDNDNTEDCNMLPKDFINLDEINMGGYKNANKFCVCEDFGQLAHYDSDIVYEHIHFCDHNSVSCNLETLFSIYDDTSAVLESNVLEDIGVVDKNEKTIHRDICWVSFECENNFENVEFDIIESNIISDELKSSPGQLRRSNRKRKSTATDYVTENTEPKSKKLVKCGACGLILSEADWNKHKNSEHDLIAWKDGQTLDMQNKSLLKKLGQKLKKLGVLKCTLCKKDIRYLSKFVEHVISCIKLKDKHTTTTSSDSLSDDAIEKKDATQKHRKTTRRTSSGLNLENDCSEISTENTRKVRITHNELGNSSKKNLKSISMETDTSNVHGNPKPTSLDVSESTKNKDSSKSGAINKTTRESDVYQKSTQPMSLKQLHKEAPKSYANVAAEPSREPIDATINVERLRNLKEIDIFSISKAKESMKLVTQSKSIKKSKNESKSECDEITLKSIRNSSDVSSEKRKKSFDVEDSNKLKRKLHDNEASSNFDAEPKSYVSAKSSTKVTATVEVETLKKLKEVNIFAVSTPTEIPSKMKSQTKSSKRSNKNEISITNLKNFEIILKPERHSRGASLEKSNKIIDAEDLNKLERKAHAAELSSNIDAKPKSDVVDVISTKKNNTITENEVNTKSHKNPNIGNIEVLPLDLPLKSISVEIEIPAHNANKDTADGDTLILKSSLTHDNTQGLVNVSSSSNRNDKHDKKSPPDKEVMVVSVKKEILSQCGVCKQQVDESQWVEHIAKEHDYLAWREDEHPLDLKDDKEVRAHLYTIAKANGGLTCSKCHTTRKYVKSYLSHFQSCDGDEEQQSQKDSTASMDTTLDLDDIPLKSYPRSPIGSVVCGVCNETVLKNKWIDHIRLEHKYLAWQVGEPPLDVEDDVAVKAFLRNISNYNGGLICSKCGAVRSYVKSWMDHQATCKGVSADESINGTLNMSKGSEYIEFEITSDTVKCAKCSLEMPSTTWIDHIEKEHNYLSWIEGQTPLDESNPLAMSAYLLSIVKKRGVLYCVKCGVTRKYPKAFLTHISACEISGFKREDFFVEVSEQIKPGEFECAICHETGNVKDWKKHAMGKHYNVAWMAGDIPINLKNFYAVEKYLKEYKAKHNLTCKVCGASRTSCYGFYAHILTCGKSEEDLEHLMEMCDTCNNKFLCIYRNQHRAMHKEQMIKKELKEQNAIKAEKEQKIRAIVEAGEPTGKRRAAEKAKKVMEKYTSNISDGSHVCASCHIEFDTDDQLQKHVCQESKAGDGSDSDVSMKIEEQEESDDGMEDVDSSISDEEEDPLKRKRHPETVPKITLPFKVRDFSYFLGKSFEHFCEMHYTNECLFNNWRRNDYRILSEDECTRYLPLLSESCKLRGSEGQWETIKRFEARRKKDTVIFTGATIRSMRWIPHTTTEVPQDHYLSVSCFRDADCPRYGKDELTQHPGMLQIWNMNQFLSTPKFAMGLAHDYGTIWAMDWCPSGARDIKPSEATISRLGLVAIACSNGCAYILSVPRLQEAEDKPIICKLNPVAELRLSMKHIQPPFRLGYQATSISWSPQKGHEVVMVGYADGTIALYDLNTESPLLKETENGVDIFYPFQDALAENSTITGGALCASTDLQRVVGGVASASVTGATMAGWPRGPTVRSHLAASSVTYTPNWPAALLCSDDVLTMKSTNEMQWWGGGRRLGGACAASACARCGRLCLTAPPFVRVLRAHPAYPEIKKQIVATVKMVPIARKRKLVTDDLGMVLEPLTYDETIKKYGLEFKALPKKDQNVASKLRDNVEQCAERFPLSDLPAAAFCPTAAHHHRLAIASHAGFVFIICT